MTTMREVAARVFATRASRRNISFLVFVTGFIMLAVLALSPPPRFLHTRLTDSPIPDDSVRARLDTRYLNQYFPLGKRFFVSKVGACKTPEKMIEMVELLYTKGEEEEKRSFAASEDCRRLIFANYKITDYGHLLHLGDKENGMYYRVFEVAFEQLSGRYYVPYIGVRPEPNEQPT